MYRIAIRTLFHLPGKLAGAIIGVAAAGTLILTQVGLYYGFQTTSSAYVARTGGDVWVVARGTDVFDNAETLSAGVGARVLAHPCVARARGVIVDYAVLRKQGGEPVTVQVLGFQADAGRWEGAAEGSPIVMPWSLARGLPDDLRAPSRVAVESLDLRTLGVTGEPIGAHLVIGRDDVVIAALTRGIRPFTLTPYIFADLPLARRLINIGEGQVSYWVLDLKAPACAPAVIKSVEEEPDLAAYTTREFVKKTQDFWVANSGIGTVLAFGAVLSLLVGMIIIGQTLSAITRSHLRELGTLKTIGASGGELVGFVAWQAAFLAVTGGALGVLVALFIRRSLGGFGLEMVLSPQVLGIGGAAVLVMCAAASLASVRRVLVIDATEVLK